MSKYVGEKSGKTGGRTETRMDGESDGHHHTIIRLV